MTGGHPVVRWDGVGLALLVPPQDGAIESKGFDNLTKTRDDRLVDRRRLDMFANRVAISAMSRSKTRCSWVADDICPSSSQALADVGNRCHDVASACYGDDVEGDFERHGHAALPNPDHGLAGSTDRPAHRVGPEVRPEIGVLAAQRFGHDEFDRLSDQFARGVAENGLGRAIGEQDRVIGRHGHDALRCFGEGHLEESQCHRSRPFQSNSSGTSAGRAQTS